MKFHMVIVNGLILKLWVHKNFVYQLQAHENWAYLTDAEKMAILQLSFSLLKNWLK